MSHREPVGAAPKQLLIGIIVVAVLIRVASVLFVAYYTGQVVAASPELNDPAVVRLPAPLNNAVIELPGTADQVSYHNLALRLLDGHGFSFGEPWWPATGAGEPTAHWSYLYTLYLAAVYFIFGPNPLVARLIQAIIVGILMPWLAYRLARRIFGRQPSFAGGSLGQGEKVGLVAAAIVAIYVYFFYYAAALMTESFYILAILWSFDLALQIHAAGGSDLRQWLRLGLALGVAVLLRQLFLLFIPFFLLWLWWTTRPKIAHLLLPLGVMAVMITPWTVRNYLAFGRIVPLNTNSGYAFFWGNHPIYGTRFVPILTPEMGSYYELIPPELLDLNEAALDSALLERGIGFILEDPGRYILLSLSRIPHYFVFWPSPYSGTISNLSRVASFGLFLPFMLYGLYASMRNRFSSLRAYISSPFFLVHLFMVIYTGIHVLTWTLIRYRLPVDAMLILFAGFALIQLAERVAARRQPRAHHRFSE